MLDILEIVHQAGYVFNDISMEKILLGPNQTMSLDNGSIIQDYFEDKTLHLVDFSFLTPYKCFVTSKHLKE